MGRLKVIKEYEDGSAVITTSPTYVSREETEEICREADVKLKKKGGKANVEL